MYVCNIIKIEHKSQEVLLFLKFISFWHNSPVLPFVWIVQYWRSLAVTLLCYLYCKLGERLQGFCKWKELFPLWLFKLLIVSKMFFSAQGGVSRPSARLPFRVGHHVCLSHLWLTPPHSSLTFDQSFEIISSIPSRPNEKTGRKQKSLAWYLSVIIFCQNIKNISRKVLLNCFMT